MPALLRARRSPRRHQLEKETPIVAVAVARQVVEELSQYFGRPLPVRYAAGLAFRAHRCYAHSGSFREKLRRPGDRGRDLLYVFMRHWLAARLRTERPDQFALLPRGYTAGAGPGA